MPAPVSIIIPTLNAAADLPLCLQSLMPGLEAGLIRELIVCDGGSEDATCQIAEAAGADLVSENAGRAQQMRAGADRARGDWLLFLHGDTALSKDWVERAVDHVAAGPDRAGVFTLAYRSDAPMAKVIAARANRRTRWLGLPYGDQGLLISRKLYDEIGGFDDVPFLEDVRIAQAIGRRRLSLLSAEARTSAAKYERDGWRRRSWRNAWIVARYLMGARPDQLARAYS